jgi:hypothetical protein
LVLPTFKASTHLECDIELKAADFNERALAVTKLEASLSRRITMNAEGPTVSASAFSLKALG